MLSVRITGQDIPGVLTFIDETWRNFSPATPLRRSFISDIFGMLYESDEKQGAMFGICVAMALLIACLGLFGIAAFTTQRRAKEIVVRKVFGAQTREVAWLLLRQFSIPVLIANAIAWPIAYYYLRLWLDGFAYQTLLHPLYFLAAGAAALGIAWMTVLGHTLHVARGRAVLALRYE